MSTKETGDARPVLVIRFSSLGDVILSEPATRAIDDRFPRSEIHYLTKSHYEEIVGCFRAVDRVIPYHRETGLAGLVRTALGLRRNGYRIVIDLHGNLRSRIVRSLVRADQVTVIRKQSLRRFLLVRFGIGRGDRWPTAGERYLACIPGPGERQEETAASLVIPEGARKSAGRFLKEAFTRPQADPDARHFVALAPGARWSTKMWPWERFAEAGLALTRQTGMGILILGSRQDRELCGKVARHIGAAAENLAGKTSLIEAAALLARSSLLATNDTGLMHLAVSVGTPTVAVFGPTTAELGFIPPGGLVAVIETELPCRPCTTMGRRNCPLGTHDCMLGVSTALVLREATRILERMKAAKV